MVALTKLYLSLACSLFITCDANKSLSVIDGVEHGKKEYDTYKARGGCYQSTMDALEKGCKMVLADQYVRDTCKYLVFWEC